MTTKGLTREYDLEERLPQVSSLFSDKPRPEETMDSSWDAISRKPEPVIVYQECSKAQHLRVGC